MNDIISQPIEYKDDVIDSRYRLVIAAAKRTRQIMEGHGPAEPWLYHKETTVGLSEILGKKVEILMGAPAVLAEKKHREATKAAHRHDEYLPTSRGYARESTEEIRADVTVYQEDPSFTGDEDSFEDDKEL